MGKREQTLANVGRSVIEARHFPIFDRAPDASFVAAWQAYAEMTGDPITFEGISTVKPLITADVRLLTEEIKVRDEVPCPLCRPSSPKFQLGRLAWFPYEKTVQFIGHKCAKTHIGDDYHAADVLFSKQSKALNIIRRWPDMQAKLPELEQFAAAIEPVLKAAQWMRESLDKDAPEFAGGLYHSLKWSQGDIHVSQAIGIKDDAGQTVMQKAIIGRLAGFEFFRPYFHPHDDLKKARAIMSDLELPLPELAAGSEDQDTMNEIITRGKRAYGLWKTLRGLRDTAEEAQKAFSKENLLLLKTWFDSGESPFATFEMKRVGNAIHLRATSGLFGACYSNLMIMPDIEQALPAARSLHGIDDR